MKPLACQIDIAAPSALVWSVVTDIERAAEHIPAIKSIEILDGPRAGKGLRWRETRVMFGREATEVMEIAEWKPPISHLSGGMYVATATSHGAAYRSEVRVETIGIGSRLVFTFEARALTFLARILSAILAPMMHGAVRKALHADLEALKARCEQLAANGRQECEP